MQRRWLRQLDGGESPQGNRGRLRPDSGYHRHGPDRGSQRGTPEALFCGQCQSQ